MYKEKVFLKIFQMAAVLALALNLMHLRKTLHSLNVVDVTNPPVHPPLSRKDQGVSLRDEGTRYLCWLI